MLQPYKSVEVWTNCDVVTHVLAGVHHELPLDGPHAVLLVLREELVARDHQRVHVGDAAARRQDAVPLLLSQSELSIVPGSPPITAHLEADDLPHLLEDLVLHEDEDWRDLVGEHVGVGGGGEPLPSQRGHVQPARQLVEEAGMACDKNASCYILYQWINRYRIYLDMSIFCCV